MPDRLTRPAILAALPSLALLACLGLAACASGGSQDTSSNPAPAGGATAGTPGTPSPSQNNPWPVKTRQHLDTWLHGFAMIQDDTAKVPFFRPGYREQMIVIRNRQNVTSALDANRERLRAGLAARPQLINAQFFPFQVTSWEETRQFVDFFLRAEGDPQRAGNAQVAQMIAIVAQYFPAKADREWLQTFMVSIEDERTKFYNLYWINTQRERAPVLAATDSVWQLVARPRLQAFLRNNQLANGELLLSLPLAGEGRTMLGNKAVNSIAVTFPETRAGAAEAVYGFVHEAALPLATTTVNDNVTPSERRDGVADRYLSSAVVYGGYLIMQKAVPDMAEGYARFYLRVAGRPSPATGAGAALEREFALPPSIRDGMKRQIDIALGGI
jgi:hypothetical protein